VLFGVTVPTAAIAGGVRAHHLDWMDRALGREVFTRSG
jgi:hypothetical protein